MKRAIPLVLSSVVAACSSVEPRAAWSALDQSAPSLPAAGPPPPAPSSSAQEREPTSSRITLLFGMRFLDEDDYDPVEDQPAFGFDYSFEPPGSPVGFEVGLMGSYQEDDILGADLEVGIGEVYGGVRKTFGEPGSVLRPYVGGGASVINVDVEISGAGSDDDSSLAGYVHGGFLGQLGESFFLGLDLRTLFGSDIEIGGVDGDADYVQLGLVLGWAF